MPVSLLFTGHMIDEPDRAEPRFPASFEMAVQRRIAKAIRPYVQGGILADGPTTGRDLVR
jgi:hypothetical protein